MIFYGNRKAKTLEAEFKYADAPRLTKSMTIVLKDLNLEHLWVIYPGKKTYRLSDRITVFPLANLHKKSFDLG